MLIKLSSEMRGEIPRVESPILIGEMRGVC